MASHPILLDFMMQFQNIMSHRQKEPFCGYHLNPSEQEPAKIQPFPGAGSLFLGPLIETAPGCNDFTACATAFSFAIARHSSTMETTPIHAFST